MAAKKSAAAKKPAAKKTIAKKPAAKKPAAKKATAKSLAPKKTVAEMQAAWRSVTEASLTADLDDELTEAWRAVRRFCVALGPQRVYAAGRSIMFSKRVCYTFVRVRKTFLEVVFFLPYALDASEVDWIDDPEKKRVAHMVKLRHAEAFEDPLPGWIREAYASTPDMVPSASGAT